MGRLFQIAVRNLLQHRRRTLLLGGAIAGVSAVLVLVISVIAGIQDTITRSATTMMSGHVNVGGFYKVTAGSGAPAVTDYRKVQELVEQVVPERDYITARGRGWAKLVSETGSMQVGVGGIEIGNEKGFHQVLKVKEDNGSLEALEQEGRVLLFRAQAEKLGVKVGDPLTMIATTLRGANNTVDLTVGAIAEDLGLMSSFNIFVPMSSLRGLYQMNENTTGVLQIYLKDMSKVSEVQERLRKAFKENGYRVMDADPRPFWFKFETIAREDWTGQSIDVTNWEEEVSFVNWIVALMSVLGGILTLVLLIIICAGIMNVLWISIRERTREVGTLRAIGMQRRSVLAMFMAEGFALAAAATVTGALLGLGLVALLNALQIKVPLAAQFILMNDTVRLLPVAGGIVGAVLLITVCTTLTSLIPSFLASRLKPVTAMQFHG